MQVLTYPILGLTEYALLVDLRQTATGYRPHYGSLSYAGDPGAADEYEVEDVTLYAITVKNKIDYSKALDIPDWLKADLIEWAGEQDRVCNPPREEEAA